MKQKNCKCFFNLQWGEFLFKIRSINSVYMLNNFIHSLIVRNKL